MANFNTSIHAQFISVFVLAFTLPKLVPVLLYIPAAVLAYSTFDGRVLAALISWLLRSVDGDRQQMDLDTLARELTERTDQELDGVADHNAVEMFHEIVGLKTGLVLWAFDLDDSHKDAVKGSVWEVTMGHLKALAKEDGEPGGSQRRCRENRAMV